MVIKPARVCVVNTSYSYLLSWYVKYCWPSTDLCWQWCNTVTMFWCIMPILTSCDTSASFEHKTSLSFIVLSIQHLAATNHCLVHLWKSMTVRCFNVHREIISIIMWQSCESCEIMWGQGREIMWQSMKCLLWNASMLVSCPARARLPARNGLVNEVKFLGLITQNR